MLFNEIIDKHGIEGIASKTNISTANLGYLIEENFERLNRVRSLGFLLILEREYKDIDVATLREKIKTYYDENRPADDKVVMVAKDSVEASDAGVSFFKFFVITALLGIGYYLYSEGKLDSLIQNIEEKQEFFDDKKALKSNVSDEDASKVVVGKSDRESVSIETPVAPKVGVIGLNDVNVSRDKETIEAALSTVEIEEQKIVVKETSEELLVNENNLSETIKQEKEVDIISSLTTVNINPKRGMLWFGFINLDTKKRREFMKKSSTSFNIDNNRWLLVTGHGYLDVVADDKTLELADNKKHYFYIDSTEIKEIDKKEFRALNGRRGW